MMNFVAGFKGGYNVGHFECLPDFVTHTPNVLGADSYLGFSNMHVFSSYFLFATCNTSVIVVPAVSVDVFVPFYRFNGGKNSAP
jgi:hypothetical protein